MSKITEKAVQWAEQKRFKHNVHKLGNAILMHTTDGVVRSICVEAEIDETGYVANLTGLITGGYDTLNGTIRVEHGRRPKISAYAETHSDFAHDSQPQRYENTTPSSAPDNQVCPEHFLVVKELTRRIRDAKNTSVIHHQV